MKYSDLSVGIRFCCPTCNEGRITAIETYSHVDGIKVTCKCSATVIYTPRERGSDDMYILAHMESL